MFSFSAGTIVGSYFSNEGAEKKPISFAELKKKTDKFIKSKIKVAKPQKKESVSKKVSSKSKEAKGPSTEELMRELGDFFGTKEKSKKNEKKASTSKPKSKATSPLGKYTVQVGSFPNKSLANERVSKLKKQGQKAFVFSGTVKGKTWYRVGIGKFAGIAEAKELRRELAIGGIIRDSIVTKFR